MKEEMPGIYGEDKMWGWPKSVVVYAQWVPFTQEQAQGAVVDAEANMEWFDDLKEGSIQIFGDGLIEGKPMSYLTRQWLFMDVREFPLPYVKRTYLTKSTSLGNDGWPNWVAGRIDEVVAPWTNKCWLSCRIQCFGGENSMFTRNAGNGTSYSWRDSSVVQTLDCFHWSSVKQRAEDWQKKNDEEGVGPNGVFSDGED